MGNARICYYISDLNRDKRVAARRRKLQTMLVVFSNNQKTLGPEFERADALGSLIAMISSSIPIL